MPDTPEKTNRENQENQQGQPGLPVDRFGGATVDPTKNVLDLVQATIKRLDDIADIRNAKISEQFTDEKVHIREILTLMRDYEEKLKIAEAKRIDSIRVVDVQAVQTANDKATAQAQVLATQVTTSAETLRALVASTATASAAQLVQIITPITDRLALLEKNQYQGAGKESVTDPILSKLIEKIDSLGASRSEGEGRGVGLNQGWVLLIGAAGLIGAILGIISFFR